MRLRVMPDYECWPLWGDGEDYNVDPASLPITEGLRQRLLAWAKAYDDTLVRDDPASSGFASPESKEAFERQGRALALDLQRELEGKASVRFWHDRD